MDYKEADEAILAQIEAERAGNYEDGTPEFPPIGRRYADDGVGLVDTLTELQQMIVDDPLTTNTERRLILENPTMDPDELLTPFYALEEAGVAELS